jgi:anti-anti-sigma factor
VELLRLEEGDTPAFFRLIGEIDLSNARQLQARLQDELRLAGRLTLDTSDLTFMDSQGLRMLIELGREAVERGTALTVLNPSRQVKGLLAVAVPTGIPGVEVLEAD